MRYIFLDIDGVLHPATAGTDRQFSPNCLRALRTIVGATGAALILSSSWQSSQAAAEVVDEELARWGLPRCSGRTSAGPTGVGAAARAGEILAWLAAKTEVEVWVALDDLPLLAHRSDGRFVQTDPAVGLTEADAARAIALLGGPADDAPSLPPPPTEEDLAATLLSPAAKSRERRLLSASVDHTVLGGAAFSFFASPSR